jgi:hypothetical protein
LLQHTLAASSTPIVVRFLCSTPSVPTMASAYFSKPHILSTVSTLPTAQRKSSRRIQQRLLTMPPFLSGVLKVAAAVWQRREALRARSFEPNAYPSVARNRCNNQTYKYHSTLTRRQLNLRLCLEIAGQRISVHEPFATDNTSCLALRQNVQQRSLERTT